MRVRLAIWFLLMSGIVGLAQVSPLHVPVTGPIFGGLVAAGPPDSIVSGALDWYGLWAYSVAKKGTKAIRVCNPGTVACADMLSDATTGKLVVTTVGGSDCSMVTCTIRNAYDQGSGGADLIQTTEAQRPVFQLNCIGTQPCMKCTAASSQFLGFDSVAPPAQGQPFTFSSVAQPLNTSTGGQMGIGTFLSNGYDGPTNRAYMFAGSTPLKTGVAANAWHAMQAVFNDTSSIIAVDGSSSTVSAGINSNGGGNALRICEDTAFTDFFGGFVFETGWWGVGFSAGQIAGMNANQHARYGF